MSRLDVYLVHNGFFKSRERAKTMIKAGKVTVNRTVCTKPAYEVVETDDIQAAPDDLVYVGRGGLKLEAAFESFDIDVSGKICADIGASTGGFTQCLLERGAKLVYAVDVGHGQLDKKIAADERVINCEGVNARDLNAESFEFRPEFISVDLSFISLELVIRQLFEFLDEKGEMVVLIKPQFEAGKQALNKKGIVRSEKDHFRVLERLIACFQSTGLIVKSVIPSSITGGDGNIEYLALLAKNKSTSAADVINIGKIVKEAFLKFR